MGIDCSTPNENDKVIFIPIECTFNQKFYARLFLAQNHTVEGRIVSPLDMLQYQIPIRAENEPLLLCLYGTHFIHAVGPDFSRTPAAFKELFDAYYNSLYVLMDNGLHSISFPLISSGIFGGSLENPVAESTKQCCRAYKKFIADYPNYEVDVKLCAFSVKEMQEAQKVFDSMI